MANTARLRAEIALPIPVELDPLRAYAQGVETPIPVRGKSAGGRKTRHRRNDHGTLKWRLNRETSISACGAIPGGSRLQRRGRRFEPVTAHHQNRRSQAFSRDVVDIDRVVGPRRGRGTLPVKMFHALGQKVVLLRKQVTV